MSTGEWYLVIGVLYSICLELFIWAFIFAYQMIPGKFFIYNKGKVMLGTLGLSFAVGMLGGFLCSQMDGYYEFFHYIFAFFPGIMLAGGLLTLLCAIPQLVKKERKKPENLVLHMKAEDYTMHAESKLIGAQTTIVNYAYYQGSVVNFPGKFPAKPVDIKAYCQKRDDYYTCLAFETLHKEKKTLKEKLEVIHTLILFLAAVCMPLPMTPAFLWYKINGAGENPYFMPVLWCLMLVVFGGMRKLSVNAGDSSAKFMRFISCAMYYVMIVWMLVELLLK